LSKNSDKDRVMRNGHVHHGAEVRGVAIGGAGAVVPSFDSGVPRRFEDLVAGFPEDVTSFFFDLKLMLPAGITGPDFHLARQAVERRLLRVVRKKDRVVWTADGFFLLVATTDVARAGAAAERVEQDVTALLAR
jgi:hypothetical protein